MKMYIARFVFLILCTAFTCAYGKVYEKVLICGVCKDIADRLPYSIKIIERIGALFEDYNVIIYENNSVDRTPDLLQRWKQKNPKVFVQSEWLDHEAFSSVIINLEQNGQFFRPERIARARNIVQNLAMSEAYEEFTYIIWLDMDFKIFPALEGIVEVFESEREWDAVFAYGISHNGAHFDWYAFRDELFPIGSEVLGNDWLQLMVQEQKNKNFQLSRTSDWYPVYSAFGGCGIYKKSSVVDCHYSAVVTPDLEKVVRNILDNGKLSNHPQVLNYFSQLGKLKGVVTIPQAVPGLPKILDPNIGFILNPDFPNPVIWKMSYNSYQYPTVCEHVTFHASMILRGHGKLFINPRLVFNY